MNTHASVELFNRIKALDAPTDEMMVLAGQVTDMNAALFDTAHNYKGCIPGVHEMLRRQGLIKGIWCLDESAGLSEGQAEEIERTCRAYPYLTDDEFVKDFLKRYKEAD